MSCEHLCERLERQADVVLELGGLPESDLEKSHAAGKWTIREILAHLADVELALGFRFLRAVAEPGAAVESFDEDAFASELAYAARPAMLSAELFGTTRALLVHHLKTLPAERLQRTTMHGERGETTALAWAELADGHAEHHLTQAIAARDGVPWTPPGTYPA